MKVDYSPQAVHARLEAVARATDLSPEKRLHAKIDYSPEAIGRRLRTVEALREACLALGKASLPAEPSTVSPPESEP